MKELTPLGLGEYKEVIETLNENGTKNIEYLGLKTFYNGKDMEVDLIFKNVSKDTPIILKDYMTLEDGTTFEVNIPD